MLKKEIVESINKYGEIFQLTHYSDGEIKKFSYSDFLQYLRGEKSKWLKVDQRKKLEDGYSVTYEKIIGIITEIPNYDEAVIASADSILNEVYSRLNGNDSRITIQSNPSRIARLDMCEYREAVEYNLTSAYLDLLLNDKEDVFNCVYALFRGGLSLQQAFAHKRNETEYIAAIYYLGIETKNIKRTTPGDVADDKYIEALSNFEELERREQTFEQDINEYSTSFENSTNEWREEQKSVLDNITNEYEKRLSDLEQVYNEKL